MQEREMENIHIRGARENNLKGIDVQIPLDKITVVTGPSGSGKTSLAMATLYAEGQRRYVETFSPYVRQFMDRMEKPAVEAVENVPPAIALGQRNSVKNSRSTVGTMTGINEYLKIIFSRLAVGHDSKGRVVRPETPGGLAAEYVGHHNGREVAVGFAVSPVGSFNEMKNALLAQGFLRVLCGGEIIRLEEVSEKKLGMKRWILVTDRLTLGNETLMRLTEAIENAFRLGQGVVYLMLREREGNWGRPDERHSDWYPLLEPQPGLFSGNSPLGACPACKGYGRAISYDYNRGIIPELSIRDGALKMLSTPTLSACYRDFERVNRRVKAVRMDVPWNQLTQKERDWVLNGNCGDMDVWQAYDNNLWYGYKGIFEDMEKHAHKLTVRVFLAYYRVYSVCPECGGGRLRPEALAFTIGGCTVPEVQNMQMGDLLSWLDRHVMQEAQKELSLAQAAKELRSRVVYLCEVGLSYLSSARLTRSLSGGEIERVSLTACLGAALTETLFVLDEPTVGLHLRDTARLVAAMRRLADRGNTLVVVEHDETVMRSADHLVDLGPGSGSGGGELVYAGAPKDISSAPNSLTGQYLTGLRCIPTPTVRRRPTTFIKIRGAECHNLHNFDVDIPLGVFCCLTGVSGSGKSTLACQVLNGSVHPDMLDDEEKVVVRSIHGLGKVQDVVLVDQSPIVRTPRSTPALYMKIFDDIRALYVAEPLAQARGLKPGYFSFNSGEGRCPRCSGLGMEKVEMQFLSDIFVPCALCHGTRYTPQALAIIYRGKNIAELLSMDVQSALAFFSGEQDVRAQRITQGLALLKEVGLGHLVLGQPLHTLSGGENQRLKLARILTESMSSHRDGKGNLLILDEPSTGLHFSDLEVLLSVFSRLVREGQSLLVIEHNMDIIKCADYVIDLGPEGGREGGKITAQGTPEQVAKFTGSHTGSFLNQALLHCPVSIQPDTNLSHDVPVRGLIQLRGARHHYLKNIDVDIPLHEMTVVTGLSGSGKSTLAFDIIFAEGQKRFMDVMSPYARQFTDQMETPDIDTLTGLPPTVAIEQNRTRGGSKSTVGTVTEIWQFLRLLYAKLGTPHCPHCGAEAGRRSAEEIHDAVRQAIAAEPKSLLLTAPVVRNRKGHYADLARWAAKHKYPYLVADGQLVQPEDFTPLDRYSNHDVDVVLAEIAAKRGHLTMNGKPCDRASVEECIDRALEMGDGYLRLIRNRIIKSATLLGTRLTCPCCGETFEDPEPSSFSFNSPRGWCPTCMGHGFVSARQRRRGKGDDDARTSELEKELRYDLEAENATSKGELTSICPTCGGQRLNPFALGVTLFGLSIAEMGQMDATEALRTVHKWRFRGREARIARNIVAEIEPRLRFLEEVGLGYLSMDRAATTLSGGELQRIRLAAQLGSNLRGVLYVLDEPTIGLHPRDNETLLDTLQTLKQRGNTLLVVEHDEDTMRRADQLIDLGPGAGIHGGQIVAQGTLKDIMKSKNSQTGLSLLKHPQHPFCEPWLPVNKVDWLEVTGCSLHNLKNVTLRIPRARFCVVTGPSGAGKTSLITETLWSAVRHAHGDKEIEKVWRSSKGLNTVRAVYQVDQSPLGKTPRSTPATYIGIFDEIRRLFAMSADARRLGFEVGRFSFNTSSGCCPECKGTGYVRREMDFLPPCVVPCETCRGARYNSRTLQVKFHGKNIAEILQMNMEEASSFFENMPRLAEPLRLLCETGLGYLTLGQASNTLSGGEAQRIKLVAELIKGKRASLTAVRRGRPMPQDLYLIEEPTIGLHPHDVRLLVQVLRRLVELGNTVVVIEHNLDLICEADYIIDMGPSAGDAGGEITAQGPVSLVARSPQAPTAPFIRRELDKKTTQAGQVSLPRDRKKNTHSKKQSKS